MCWIQQRTILFSGAFELCFGNPLQFEATALVEAARNGHAEIVTILIQQGANIEAADRVHHFIYDNHF